MSRNFITYEQRELDCLCRVICEIDDNILAAVVSEDAELIGTCLRKEFPVPEKRKLTTMLLQAGIVFSIARTSEDFHGRARCVTLRYANVDEHLFPLAPENNRMLIVSTRPDEMDAELIGRIASAVLAKNENDNQILRE